MLRSKPFVRPESRATEALQYVAYIAVFTVAVFAEKAFDYGVGPQTQALTFAGIVGGTMLVIHERRWLQLLALSLVLRIGWKLCDPSLPISTAIIDSSLLIGLCAFFGMAPALFFSRNRNDISPSEFLALSTGALAVTSTIYAVASGYFNPAVEWSALSLIASGLSLFVGTGLVAPLIVTIGLPFGEPARYSQMRLFDITLTSGLFLLGVSLGFGHWPAFLHSLFEELQFAWVWLAIPFLIWMSVRGGPAVVSLNLFLMLLIASAAFYFERGYFTDPASKRLLVEWQMSVIGFLFTGLTIAALAASGRQNNRLRRIQERIGEALMRAETPDGQQDGTLRDDALRASLGSIGTFSGADQCRLYWIDNETGRCGCSIAWTMQDDAAPALKPHSPVSISSLRWFFGKIGDNQSLSFSHDGRTTNRRPKIVQILKLPDTCACFFQPITLEGHVIGMIGVIAENPDELSVRDARPLLSQVGSFYANLRAREGAQSAINKFEQRLRELASKLTQSDERVRRHTSVELHDGLIQQLAVARMKLGELRHRRVSAPQTVEKITTIIDETLAATRSIVHQLSPSVLYELGLVPGVESLCDELRARSAFAISVREHGERRPLDEPVRVGFYQVIRELINNAIRHSRGSQIWVDIFWNDSGFDCATVADNGSQGRWWHAEEAMHGGSGLGLLSASERLRLLGYCIEFEDRNDGGTTAAIVSDQSAAESGSFNAWL